MNSLCYNNEKMKTDGLISDFCISCSVQSFIHHPQDEDEIQKGRDIKKKKSGVGATSKKSNEKT